MCEPLVLLAKSVNKSSGNLPAKEETAAMGVSRSLKLKGITHEGLRKLFRVFAMDPQRV